MILLLALAACVTGGLGDIGVDTGGAFFECDTTAADAPLEAGFEADLAPDGCRFRIAATDDDAQTLLLLDVPAFADAVAGEPVSVVYTLPDDDVVLEVQRGCGLDEGTCESSIAEPVLIRTYTPTAGTIAVEAAGDGEDVVATVTLTGVAFESDYDETVTIEALTWSDVRLYAVSE